MVGKSEKVRVQIDTKIPQAMYDDMRALMDVKGWDKAEIFRRGLEELMRKHLDYKNHDD